MALTTLSNLAAKAGVNFSSFLQPRQFRRTKRWPMTQFKEGASKNGFVPMERKRGMAAAALLVCRVDSIKWPVKAA